MHRRHWPHLIVLALLSACPSNPGAGGTECPSGTLINPVTGECGPLDADVQDTEDASRDIGRDVRMSDVRKVADASAPDMRSDVRDIKNPSDMNDIADVSTRPPESELSLERTGCAFGTGALAIETIGAEFRIGDELPFDHIILLMQENRSFDHYFGTMPGVEGFPADYENLDSNGVAFQPFHQTRVCNEGVGHSWNESQIQYNGGANDGFVITNDPNGGRALGYFDDTELPYYWGLYSTFAMSDHHHSSVLGPTWVNRYYYTSGTSFGLTSNQPIPVLRSLGENVIFQLLDRAGLGWKVYYESAPFVGGAYPAYMALNRDRLVNTNELFQDLANDTLPAVSYVDPRFLTGAEGGDEHAPANVQIGQAWVASVMAAVMQSPAWPRTVVVLTYDEHGGFFDHVPPPPACHPGDYPPDLSAGDEPGDFDRLGFRVPLVVVSPFSKPGYVSDRVTDLSSILRLIEVRFGLPALTGRDANAWPLLDMFDFDNPPFLTPPTTLPPATVDIALRAQCLADFGP